MSSAHFGDSHNFGRRVEVRRARVFKPRPLIWEWLFLSAKSPLRRSLDGASRKSALGAFTFLPDLTFFQPRTLDREGEVEHIDLQPLGKLRAGEKMELAQIVGRSLALWSFFGLSDLHWENLVLGRARDGRIIFCPVDIELVLSDLISPTETKLLPERNSVYREILRHAAGVRRVLPHLGKPIAREHLAVMVESYRATFVFLQDHGSAMAKILLSLPQLRTTPIRICLRGTGDYVLARQQPIWPPLLPEEVEQLDRDDIPYFFHLYGRRGIHYFTDPACTRASRVAKSGGSSKTDPVLALSRGLGSANRARLLKNGISAIRRAFDQANPSNVYLPCRCGERRTVFAHAVRCPYSG